MRICLLQRNSNMAKIIRNVVGFFILGLGLNGNIVLANGNIVLANGNNINYSIIDDHQTCELIIPKFVEQIMSQQAPLCGETGVFPKPGNCSMFFKCVQSDTVIQPYIEYCSVGYNFVNNVCVPNTNSSDCPQYTCRIPDGANAIGNEIGMDDEVSNDKNNVQSLPLISPSTSPAAVTVDSTTELVATEISDNTVEQMDQSGQMTLTQDKSSGSNFIYDPLIISVSMFLLCSNIQ